MRGTRGTRVRLGECRDCHEPIKFVRLDTDSVLPVNPGPNPEGNVSVRLIGGRLVGYVISQAHPHDGVSTRMTPHAATCPATKRKPPPDPADESLF